jgi:hypothetical protein
MPLTDNCPCETPEIPDYFPAPPADDSCQGCCDSNRPVFYEPPEAGLGSKPTEVIDGNQIQVDDLSDAFTYRFRPNYAPRISLVTDLTVFTPYIAGVNALLNGLVLFGRTVDRVDLTWTENKTVVSQTVASDVPGFVPPTLLPGDRAKSLTGLSFTSDRFFTIAGDDGDLQPGSTDSDTEYVRFGNYVRWGFGVDKIGGLASTMQALFNGLAGSINTNTRARSIFATGGVNQYMFYFVPARFGEVTFQKGIFIGGFVRLKNVLGTLYQTVPDGGVEIAIPINNGFASENYYVYQAIYDNQVDPVTPIVAS